MALFLIGKEALEHPKIRMFRLDGCFRLNLSGEPENAPDHVMEGEYLDEEGESQLDVFWVMETDDARQAFKKDGAALRQIGNRTKMLRFILEDEYAHDSRHTGTPGRPAGYSGQPGKHYSGTEESFGFSEQGNSGKLTFLRL